MSREPTQCPPAHDLHWLVGIVERLLAPDGCPWDREQTLDSLRTYVIEEAYEVIDAIEAGDKDGHCEELGDLLFQIVFQSRLAKISLSDVIGSIGDKLIRRHPHVFGDAQIKNSQEVVDNWERLKRAERSKKGDDRGALDGIPRSLPALQRSQQLVDRTSRAGLSREKVQPHADPGRLLHALMNEQNSDQAHKLLGALLFSLVWWARGRGLEPETALRETGQRFQENFSQLERKLAGDSRGLGDCADFEVEALFKGTARSSLADQSGPPDQ